MTNIVMKNIVKQKLTENELENVNGGKYEPWEDEDIIVKSKPVVIDGDEP